MASAPKPLRATGRCLCGAVAYELRGPLRDVVNCHCSQCLRTHGNVAAYTRLGREDLVLTEDRGLKWYRSSDRARRGFCRECGASLFWEPLGADTVAVAAGSIDRPTGLKTIRHIYVADKSDYYDIADGLEALPGGHDAQ
ncbi:MAG: GFA family protein [Kiloniellaceae bacterium]